MNDTFKNIFAKATDAKDKRWDEERGERELRLFSFINRGSTKITFEVTEFIAGQDCVTKVVECEDDPELVGRLMRWALTKLRQRGAPDKELMLMTIGSRFTVIIGTREDPRLHMPMPHFTWLEWKHAPPPMNQTITPEEMNHIRRRLRLDQTTMGKMMGVARVTYCNLETGKARIKKLHQMAFERAVLEVIAKQEPHLRDQNLLPNNVYNILRHLKGWI